jgi:hypothetical protein
VAGLLASAARLRAADEEAAATTVSAMVEAIRDATSTPQVQRRRSMVGKLFAGKALAVMATVALTASGAAAATGSLPDPVQGVVAGAVSHVGVDIPQPADQSQSADHRQDGEHRQSGDTPGQSGDDHGQSGQSGGSSGDHGQGSQISTIAHDPALAGQPKGPTVCAAASDGKCHAGEDNHDKSGVDESTTTTTAGAGDTNDDDNAEVSDDPAGNDSGDDHGNDHVTPPTTPTTGSPATGEDHSGHDTGSSSGKGESGSHH